MKSKKDNGVFEAIRMAAMSHHLLTAGTILCVAASVVASLLPPLLWLQPASKPVVIANASTKLAARVFLFFMVFTSIVFSRRGLPRALPHSPN